MHAQGFIHSAHVTFSDCSKNHDTVPREQECDRTVDIMQKTVENIKKDGLVQTPIANAINDYQWVCSNLGIFTSKPESTPFPKHINKPDSRALMVLYQVSYALCTLLQLSKS
jgi:hypothetical protein